MQNKELKSRRTELLRNLKDGSIAIIFSARKPGKNLPYRQNSDFYYLTGFIEPESIAVLVANDPQKEYVLFNRKYDLKRAVWEGPCAGQKGACHRFCANQSFAISDAEIIIPKLLAHYNNVYSNTDSDGNFDPRITSWLKKAGSIPHKLINVGSILYNMRLKKSASELKTIRKAVDITAMGHLRAMSKCRPKMYEYELEAEILHEFVRLGGRNVAFPTIVASGANACILHYSKNNKRLASGELVLVDAGAEYEHYCADVSRTFPVGGKFMRIQRIIYEIVLSAQMETIRQIGPGLRWDRLQAIAEEIITAGLIKEKLLYGKLETLLSRQKFKPFFMHKIGHWLGLDVHDVEEYQIDGKWCNFEPGMILTIEPGVYSKRLNMGIRIEDNILVTENGHEVLTTAIPKNVIEIEKIMSK